MPFGYKHAYPIYTVGPPYTYHAPSPPALSLQKKEDEMAHHGMSHQW
jgi:hypothetical protein